MCLGNNNSKYYISHFYELIPKNMEYQMNNKIRIRGNHAMKYQKCFT